MSETKLEKRMVSKGKYVRVMGKKVGLYSCASVVFGIALGGYAATIFILTSFLDPPFRKSDFLRHASASAIVLVAIIVFSLSLVLLHYSRCFYKEGKTTRAGAS